MADPYNDEQGTLGDLGAGNTADVTENSPATDDAATDRPMTMNNQPGGSVGTMGRGQDEHKTISVDQQPKREPS